MIPYGRQSVDDDDISAVSRVLKGEWLTRGPAVGEFEEDLAERVDAQHAVAFSNGTAALHAAMAAAEIGPGDQVATSALSFAASAACAVYVGATPTYVDIDPATLNLDPALVPADVDALVAVHYAGLPVDLTGLAHRPRVVVEDAAQALGAETADGPVGNCAHSDMTTFSFHPVKTITTAEGGAVTTNNADLADRLRAFRHHNQLPGTAEEPWAVHIDEPGFNYRLTDVQAALGSSQMHKLDRFLNRREEIARRYDLALTNVDVLTPAGAPVGGRHARHLYPIRVEHRRAVYHALHEARHRRAGPLRPHPPPRGLRLRNDRRRPPPHRSGLRPPALAAGLPRPDRRRAAPRDRGSGDRRHGEPMSPLDRSEAWWRRAEAVIPLGTQTLSKSPTQWVDGLAPKYIQRAEGAHLTDVDGNEWIDWPMALGPVLLGHGDQRVDDAIRAQLANGITFTLMHPLEVEVAERITAICPGVEAVRFAKSGSDAVSAAVRAARAFTGRDVVLCSGYHGWHDWYIGSTTRDRGVPKAVQDLTATFRYGDLDHLDHVLAASAGDVAAVVLEPSGRHRARSRLPPGGHRPGP